MGSISTTRGDAGQTGLAGGIRVSKASLRVDAYGNVDELISTLGFARSICDNADIEAFAHSVQRELFKVGSAMATPPQSPKPQVPIGQEMVDRLTAEVHRLEALEGMVSDWSVSGEHTAAAAFDMARTICRARRTRRRAAGRIGRDGAADDPRVSQSPLRPAVAVRPQARTGRGRQRLAARRHGQNRQPLVARVVTGRIDGRVRGRCCSRGASHHRRAWRRRAVRARHVARRARRPRRGLAAPAAAPAPAPQRIVSTSPTVTETLFALGLGDRVVGVSRYCRYPAAVAALPKIGTFLKPDAELIARLRPDLVIMHESHTTTAQRLKSLSIRYITVERGTLASVFSNIRDIGAAAGVADRAAALVRDLEQQLARVRQAWRDVRRNAC